MANYDFKDLSPIEFEALVHDLLERERNISLESFTEGRDDGIDLRYAPSADREIIVQCKHYAVSGWNSLFASLHKEVTKVKKLKPTEYILVTSCPLTPKRKSQIIELFDPYIASPKNIYGHGELNALLRRYPDVEQSAFKLWIASTPILQRVLHSDILENTAAFLAELEPKTKVFVPTKAFSEAIKILEAHNVCIIAGPPGIGKTTLAGMILLHLAKIGYEPVVISNDISEGNALYEGIKNKIFLYDDFLGQTSLSEKPLSKNEDNRLRYFMQRVANSKGRRKFILSTREYLLAAAKHHHERIEGIDIEFNKYVLDLSSYSMIIRAKVLYNHLYFSNLDKASIKSVIKDASYLKIINHPNYNPRLIEKSVALAPRENAIGDAFFSFFKKIFDNPSLLWGHIYDHQLGASERAVLLALLSLPRQVRISDLKRATSKLYSRLEHENLTDSGFRKSLELLEDTFIKIGRIGDDNLIELHNPSIRDYLRSKLIADIIEFEHLLLSAVYFEQVEWLLEEATYQSYSSLNDKDVKSPLFRWSLSHRREIQKAIKRCIRSKPCTISYIRYEADGEIHAHEQYIFEARVVALLKFESILKLEFDKQWFSGVMQTLLHRWRNGQGNVRACAELIRYSWGFSFLERKGTSWLLENVSTAEELKVLADLWEDYPHIFKGNKEEEFFSLFDEIVEREADYIKYDADDQDTIYTIWRDLQSLKKITGRDIFISEESISKRISELEERNVNNPAISATLSKLKDDDGIEDINAMFATLLCNS